MPQELALKGELLLIEIGNGQTPEQFNHPCVINTNRGINFQAETTDTPTFDCDKPGAIAWKQREKTLLSADITGAGRIYTGSTKVYSDWLASPNTKNVRVTIDAPPGKGGGYWIGAYHLTQFQAESGGVGTTVDTSISLQSSGEVGPFVEAT